MNISILLFNVIPLTVRRVKIIIFNNIVIKISPIPVMLSISAVPGMLSRISITFAMMASSCSLNRVELPKQRAQFHSVCLDSFCKADRDGCGGVERLRTIDPHTTLHLPSSNEPGRL
jgi:hypothetical protein